MKALPLALLLAACGGQGIKSAGSEPIIVTKEVAVAVDAPCVPETLGPRPQYVDTKEKLLAAEDASVRMQLLYAGRAQREARLNEIEPVIDGCPRGSVKK